MNPRKLEELTDTLALFVHGGSPGVTAPTRHDAKIAIDELRRQLFEPVPIEDAPQFAMSGLKSGGELTIEINTERIKVWVR